MRMLIMSFIQEIDKDMKLAKAVIVGGGATTVSSVMEWLPIYAGLAASFITIILSLFVFYVHYKRNKREEAEHKLKMLDLQKRRSTDDK